MPFPSTGSPYAATLTSQLHSVPTISSLRRLGCPSTRPVLNTERILSESLLIQKSRFTQTSARRLGSLPSVSAVWPTLMPATGQGLNRNDSPAFRPSFAVCISHVSFLPTLLWRIWHCPLASRKLTPSPLPASSPNVSTLKLESSGETTTSGRVENNRVWPPPISTRIAFQPFGYTVRRKFAPRRVRSRPLTTSFSQTPVTWSSVIVGVSTVAVFVFRAGRS
ncbi:hypothetical protein LMG26411_04909 [Cupriavidus numazuensis]|uniref:Uncharacterized protein n=1 Tax=Cupriavidus numazuensis TaxID=221992 RepID=A0ABM8TMU2_9BURK|nr:hypothetical protein LMG26411_04909 [Cupriavidus numazuensis]